MGQILHGSAKITHAIRAEIQRLKASAAHLARAVRDQGESGPEVAHEAFCRIYANGSLRRACAIG